MIATRVYEKQHGYGFLRIEDRRIDLWCETCKNSPARVIAKHSKEMRGYDLVATCHGATETVFLSYEDLHLLFHPVIFFRPNFYECRRLTVRELLEKIAKGGPR